MKYYVVADPHGFCTKLQEALAEKGFFAEKEGRKLIVCGDLFDRGREAPEMQAFILDLMEREEVLLVKGNHEDLALELLENARDYLVDEMTAAYCHHGRNGTVFTLLQLTGWKLQEAIGDVDGFVAAARQTPYVQKIIPAMRNYYETEKHIFVHGWIPCEEAFSPNFGKCYFYEPNWRKAEDAKWGKARWFNGMLCHNQGVLEDGKTIVCGHYRCSYGHSMYEMNENKKESEEDYTPYYNEGIIALDACTKHSGFVNCIVVEDEAL